jgi:hypothetical protein
MSVDFTVVIRVRARFGSSGGQLAEEPTAPFVGQAKSFEFDCPSVDTSKEAALLFQTLGVTHRSNKISVNGVDLYGGIPTSNELLPIPGSPTDSVIELNVWITHILLIPDAVLRTVGNTLRIEARAADGGTDGTLDNFIVDNAVVFYKTRVRFASVLARRKRFSTPAS